MAVWPDDLPPLPLYDGYQEVPPRTALRTNMDAGPVKVRRRYSANVRLLKVRYSLTAEQVELLDQFFVETAEGGAVSFTWVHPRTGVEVEVRFGAEPRYTVKSPDLYLAEVEIEILPGTTA